MKCQYKGEGTEYQDKEVRVDYSHPLFSLMHGDGDPLGPIPVAFGPLSLFLIGQFGSVYFLYEGSFIMIFDFLEL